MKIKEDSLVLLPNGDLTTGEKIMKALELEKRILNLVRGEQE
jgi:hypothetical protein